MKQVKLHNFSIGGPAGFVLIAGPCVIENEAAAMEIAVYLKQLTARLDIPFIFKASYDKANRTSLKGKRGVGMEEGQQMLATVRDRIKFLVRF